MAFFKFRKGADEPAATRQPPESIEAMRKRARHRLIGAGVLVLLGVIGFPLLFDTQPRPIAVDIPIEIPDRNKTKPLAAPAKPVVQAPVVSGPVTAPAPAAASAPLPVQEAAAPMAPKVAEAPAAPPSAPKSETPPAAKPEAVAAAKPEPKAAAKPDDGAKAKALLEGTGVEKVAASADGRFVVQVGAFADAAKAREARLKLERAGLKTYTNVAETKDGKRIRVRVGPFGSKADADKAAGKIKGLDLPAAVLTL
jgi:DedD protein